MKIPGSAQEFEELLGDFARAVDGDKVVLVIDTSKGDIEVYSSVEQLIMEFLAARQQMAVCAPFYNVMVDKIDGLEAATRGERPEGRPLSFERDSARKAFRRGLEYQTVLCLLKGGEEFPPIGKYSEDYRFGAEVKRRPLTLADANRIRRAVDAEWVLQYDSPAPKPPRLWWRDDSFGPAPRNVVDEQVSGSR